MASKSLTSATTALYISASLPATYDSTGFTALTWIAVGEISSYGAFGGKTNIVKFTPVDTNTVAKRGGSQDFGAIALTLARHTGADVTAMNNAFIDRQPRAFKIVYPTALGQTDYFTGIVVENTTNIGNSDKILEANVNIEIDNTILTF
jgi:hypothetical protein